MNFKLHARINRSDAETIRQALDQLAREALSGRRANRTDNQKFAVPMRKAITPY
jgi:hypothetical protein